MIHCTSSGIWFHVVLLRATGGWDVIPKLCFVFRTPLPPPVMCVQWIVGKSPMARWLRSCRLVTTFLRNFKHRNTQELSTLQERWYCTVVRKYIKMLKLLNHVNCAMWMCLFIPVYRPLRSWNLHKELNQYIESDKIELIKL